MRSFKMKVQFIGTVLMALLMMPGHGTAQEAEDGNGDVYSRSQPHQIHPIDKLENRSASEIAAQKVSTPGTSQEFFSYFELPIRIDGSIIADPVDVHAADMDGDDDKDLLVAVYFNHDFLYLENNGDGTFQDPVYFNGDNDIIRPLNIETADLNGDSDPDIVTSSRNKVSWFENEGDGTYSDEKVISEDVYYPYGLHIADMGNDGDLDVFAATYNNEVIWFENFGSASLDRKSVV